MGDADPQPKFAEQTPRPAVIAYAGTPQAKSRRGWVFVVVGIYLLLVAALMTLPLWFFGNGDSEPRMVIGVAIALMILCGFALLLTPVRAARRRPMTRRSILIPIIASGLLLGGLVYGGGIALAELCKESPADSTLWAVVAGAVAVWIAWSIVFNLIARTHDPTRLGMQLHRILIAGSVLELLIAVPSHLIVRRRTECCAGILTAAGICIGVAIALVSFGPSVLMLYYKRCKQITVRTKD